MSEAVDEARRTTAIESLQGVVTRSRRAAVVAFHSSFVRGESGFNKPPLANLIQGGRGGQVRLRLFLCMTLIATQAPHSIKDPFAPMYWARLLAMDPTHGPRQVSAGLKWLNDNNFIQPTPRRGSLPEIQLLDPRTGKKLTRPVRDFVEVPLGLWSQGWIIDLSATGIALLLVLLHARGPHRSPRYVPTTTKEAYGLSNDTWTRATHELEEANLLEVGRTPQGGTFDFRRLRNTYRIKDEILTPKAADL